MNTHPFTRGFRHLLPVLGLALFFTTGRLSRATVDIVPEPGNFIGGASGALVEFRKTQSFGVSNQNIDQLFAYPVTDSNVTADATDNGVSVINYLDGGGGNDFPNPRDVGVPPLVGVKTTPDTFVPNGGADNNFAMRATGYIYIPTAGPWTFAVKSDDTCRLKLGKTGAVVTQYDFGRGPAFYNGLSTGSPGTPGTPGAIDSVANVPSPGFYQFELMWTQGGGGAMVQFSASPGDSSASIAGNILPSGSILVGNTANGGLAIYQNLHPGVGPLATTGTQVPGEPFGTNYTKLGIPSFDSNTVGFLATIKPQALPPLQAIVYGAPKVLIREGDLAPGVPDAVFLKFNEPLFANGHYAFVGTLSPGYAGVTKTNAMGIWSSALGSLALVARQGDPAPGIAGATFKSFVSVALPKTGGSVFVAKLAGVPPTQSLSLWRETAGGLVLVLQQGASVAQGAAPARVVTTFAALASVAGSPDQNRMGSDGSIPVRITFSDHSQAIATSPADGSALVPVVASGDAPVSPSTVKFASFGLPSETASGAFGFLGTLQQKVGGVVSANSKGLFGGTDDDLALAVQATDDAPGTTNTPPLDKFFSFNDPVVAGSGSLAFLSKLAPSADATRTTNMGVWSNASGTLQLVARMGGPAPGVDGAVFQSFTSVALPESSTSEGPVFLAKLAIGPGGVDKTNYIGLWATDSTGAAHLLVRTGDMVPVNSTTKKVTLITALGAVIPSPAQPRALGGFNTLVYRLTFSDHSQSVYVNSLP